MVSQTRSTALSRSLPILFWVNLEDDKNSAVQAYSGRFPSLLQLKQDLVSSFKNTYMLPSWGNETLRHPSPKTKLSSFYGPYILSSTSMICSCPRHLRFCLLVRWYLVQEIKTVSASWFGTSKFIRIGRTLASSTIILSSGSGDTPLK